MTPSIVVPATPLVMVPPLRERGCLLILAFQVGSCFWGSQMVTLVADPVQSQNHRGREFVETAAAIPAQVVWLARQPQPPPQRQGTWSVCLAPILHLLVVLRVQHRQQCHPSPRHLSRRLQRAFARGQLRHRRWC